MVNEWTRDDLPAVMDLVKASAAAMATDPSGGAYAALDAVVDHLNAHHPKPVPGMLWATKADADRWRRAHEIVEQERDQARERLREVDSALAKCMSDFQDMEDESDEWKARAEAAEARTAPAVDRDVVEAELVDGLHRGFTAEQIARRVCAAIDPDPVEDKARELWEVARFKDSDEWSCLLQVERDCYRRMAAHVLGQEDRHVDQ